MTTGFASDATEAAVQANIVAAGYNTGGGGGGTTGPITSGVNSAKCVDDSAGSTANGNKIQMWDCQSGNPNQQWTVASGGTLQVFGKCLDITGANYNNGTLIELWDCNGGGNQQWQASNGAAGQPGLRQVPGRPQLQHRQRHPARAVDLQRRHQPAMAPALTRA